VDKGTNQQAGKTLKTGNGGSLNHPPGETPADMIYLSRWGSLNAKIQFRGLL